MSASWYKLKSGDWGVKIKHDGRVNEEISLTNSKGEQKTVYLVERAAKFDDAQLWSITFDAPAEEEAF